MLQYETIYYSQLQLASSDTTFRTQAFPKMTYYEHTFGAECEGKVIQLLETSCDLEQCNILSVTF